MIKFKKSQSQGQPTTQPPLDQKYLDMAAVAIGLDPAAAKVAQQRAQMAADLDASDARGKARLAAANKGVEQGQKIAAKGPDYLSRIQRKAARRPVDPGPSGKPGGDV